MEREGHSGRKIERNEENGETVKVGGGGGKMVDRRRNELR